MTLIGMWIGIAPFVPLDLSSIKLNNFIMGAIVAAASYRLPRGKTWQRWVGVIFGLWVCLSACFPAFVRGSGYLWNNFGSGTLIALAGILAMARHPVRKHA
jgi:hypothetical protein